MQTARSVLWLKVNFWVGAVFDAATLAPMLSPRLATRLFGIVDRSADSGFRYAMLVGAALMAGWTCLLVWAAQKPIERRAVALLTAVPVLAGLIFSSGFAIASGFMQKADIVPTLVFQALVGMSYVGSYFASTPARLKTNM
jgi:hypothetical protein